MEKFFSEIFLQAIEIITLVIGVVGVLLSLMLLFAPQLLKKAGAILNRSVDIDSKITQVIDRDIPIDNLIYRHNIISGVCLIVASAFVLVFLFYRLDVNGFLKVFFADGQFNTTDEIIFSTMALIAKIASVIGIMIGSILLFSPDQMRQIEKRLDTWFATKPLWDKLDRPFNNVDALVFRRPTVFGILGLVTSAFLTFLAVKNLLE
jgi:hypothetical protein